MITTSAAGNSPPSDAANPLVLFSSSQIPTNVPANQTNDCVVDSIPVSGTATIRIYGAGGVGTSYTRKLGFGNVTRPAGSITGLAFSTQYYLIYHAGAYAASTTYSDTLPDGYEWVATIITCPSTGSYPATCTLSWITSGTSNHLSAVDVGALGYGYGTAAVVFTGGVGVNPSVTAICSGGQVVAYSVKVAGNLTTLPSSVDVNVVTPYLGGGAANGGARYVVAT